MISLGLVKPRFKVNGHTKKYWTKEEIDLLKFSENPREVKIPGRSRDSILGAAHRLGLIEKFEARRPWSKKDEKLVLKLAKEGKTPSQIVKMNILPFSRTSIQKKLSSIGLSRKVKFSKQLKEKFKDFLRENWVGKTPKDLVDLWNENNEIKVHKRKVNKYLAVLNLCLPRGELNRIVNLRKREQEIRQKEVERNNRKDKPLIDAIRAARAEFMAKRIELNRDLWSGMPLSTNDIYSMAKGE